MNGIRSRSLGGTLYLLFGAVALLLAIGCGNVSILLLARGARRGSMNWRFVRADWREPGLRIIRQLLTESLLLSLHWGGAGRVVGLSRAFDHCWIGCRSILSRMRRRLPDRIYRCWRFSVAVALLTGILFGLWPALQLSRPEVSQVMQASTRKIAGGVQGRAGRMAC
jgi:hypothetical protein